MSMSYFVNQIMRDMSRMLENQMRLTDEVFRNAPGPLLAARRFLEEPQRDQVIQHRDKFQVKLDVQDFKPEEISVKTTDNMIEVEGKHEEKRDDHGFVQRHFVRKFLLPQGHDLKNVVSKYSPNGVLTIVAPKKPEAIEGEKEQAIPVQHLESAEKKEN